MRFATLFNGLTLVSLLAGATPQLDDLVAFETDFFEVDRSYSVPARAEASRRLKDLKARAGSISDTRFILELSQIAALADNGHTGVMYRGDSPELGRVAMRLAPFGGEFIALQAAPENADVLGGRLISIDGTNMARLLEVARTLVGGVTSRRDAMAPLFLESPGQLHALGLARDPARATYVFQTPAGQRREFVLKVATPPGGGLDATMALLSPEDAPSGWRTLLAAEKAPWSLQEIGRTMRFRDLPQADAVHIQLRANRNGDRPIAEFLAECEAARRKSGRRNVILDMRMNGGGDLTTTREWMRALPSKLPPGGRIVLLTSPWTFSAAISSTGYVKQAGGSRVILVGETPGDRLDFFAEGRPIRLPNSGAFVLMATERHDYAHGCRGYRDCHPEVARYPIEVPNLDPEIKAPWTIDAYVAGCDPGLESALKVLRRQANPAKAALKGATPVSYDPRWIRRIASSRSLASLRC